MFLAPAGTAVSPRGAPLGAAHTHTRTRIRLHGIQMVAKSKCNYYSCVPDSSVVAVTVAGGGRCEAVTAVRVQE